MTLTLLTAYNAPYLAALTFVLLTGIAELIALLCGHSLSSAMDTPDLPEGLTGEALDWLNIGRIPLLIVLCMLAGFFGISGILLQGLIIHLLQAPAPNILLTPLCLLLTCPLVHRTGRLIAPGYPVMKQRRSPRRHSSAVWPPSPVITQWRVPPVKVASQTASGRFITCCWSRRPGKNSDEETK